MDKYIAPIKNNPKTTKLFVVIFYCVGIIGFMLPISHALFVKLIPLALLLSFTLLLIFHATEITKKSLLVFTAIYLCSFIIESVGVKTGIIFGNYSYGSGLGIKFFQTPLIIGINWLFMVYTSAVIVNTLKTSHFIKILLASGIMIAYDVFLEQMAPKLNMWYWSNNKIPLQNYIAWFVLAFIFHSLIKIARIRIKNRIAETLLIVQFLFFVVLLFASEFIL